MPAPIHSSQPITSYFQTLLDAVPLPDADRTPLSSLSTPQIQSIDLLLRLVTNAPCPPDAPAPVSGSWLSWQSTAQAAVQNFLRGSEQIGSDTLNPKRKRTASSSSSDAIAPTKKPKTDSPEQDDPPRVTLHALSVSAPLRKKLDITLHTQTLRLTHPTTHATEAVFPLSALARSGRAFLLPTRGKAKKGWSVLVLASDVPAPETKGKPTPTAADAQFQLAFSIDAEPAAPFSITLHEGDGAADTVRHAKGTPTAPVLREQFLSHLPCAVLEPAPDAFTSVVGGPGAGIAAYRGAKEETLWFLRDGVLNEGKRSEFWALADLDGEEAVRLLSATGRTCSLFIRRKPPPIDVDAEAGEEPEGEETEFGMIDGREQEGIKEWVRRRKALFGKDKGKGKGKETGEAVNGQAHEEEGEDIMRDSDEDDSDFEVSSGEYDGGSPSSSSDSDSDNPRSEGVESGSEDGDSEEGEEGHGSASGSDSEGAGEEPEEEDGPLDPKHHPLMRPGAMPRMSKAAVDMAVGMVTGDIMGGGKAVEYEEDEEDELDD